MSYTLLIMDDTIIIKATTAATLAASGVSFPRVRSEGSEALRQSLDDGSLNPMVLRIAHQPITAKRNKQRSLCAIDKTYSRVDGLGNVIGKDESTVALQFSRTAGVTKAEFIIQLNRLIGGLYETRGGVALALAEQLFNTEE